MDIYFAKLSGNTCRWANRRGHELPNKIEKDVSILQRAMQQRKPSPSPLCFYTILTPSFHSPTSIATGGRNNWSSKSVDTHFASI